MCRVSKKEIERRGFCSKCGKMKEWIVGCYGRKLFVCPKCEV